MTKRSVTKKGKKKNNKHYRQFQFYFFNQTKFDAKISCKTTWSYFSYPEQVKQMKTREACTQMKVEPVVYHHSVHRKTSPFPTSLYLSSIIFPSANVFTVFLQTLVMLDCYTSPLPPFLSFQMSF